MDGSADASMDGSTDAGTDAGAPCDPEAGQVCDEGPYNHAFVTSELFVPGELGSVAGRIRAQVDQFFERLSA